MSDELKACPFCNAALYVESGDFNRAFHPISGDCWVSGSSWRIKQDWVNGWNSRPIESSLESRLKIAVEALEEISRNQYISAIVDEVARDALAKIRS